MEILSDIPSIKPRQKEYHLELFGSDKGLTFPTYLVSIQFCVIKCT